GSAPSRTFEPAILGQTPRARDVADGVAARVPSAGDAPSDPLAAIGVLRRSAAVDRRAADGAAGGTAGAGFERGDVGFRERAELVLRSASAAPALVVVAALPRAALFSCRQGQEPEGNDRPPLHGCPRVMTVPGARAGGTTASPLAARSLSGGSVPRGFVLVMRRSHKVCAAPSIAGVVEVWQWGRMGRSTGTRILAAVSLVVGGAIYVGARPTSLRFFG